MINDIIHATDEYIVSKRRFKNATDFSVFIEKYCFDNNVGYMEGIIDYCSNEDIEIESIGSLISKALKEKIRVEAQEQNFFRTTGKLEL